MKKHIMIILMAICILFSLNSIESSAADLPKIPNISSIVKSKLTHPPKVSRAISDDSDLQVLDAPVELTNITYSSNGVKVEWEAYNHKNVYEYVLTRMSFSDVMTLTEEELAERTLVIEIPAEYTTYLDASKLSEEADYPPVKAGEAYIYSIVALIGKDADSITHMSNADPNNPLFTASIATVKKPTVTVSNLSNGIKVSWNKISNADGFFVYRKIYGKAYNYDDPFFHSTKGTATSYTNTKFTKGTSYCYQVEPYVKVETADSIYFVPGNLSASKFIRRMSRPSVTVSNSDSTINLSWAKIAGATGYEIFRNGKYVTRTSKSSWSDSNRTNGSKYTYNVCAYYEKLSLKSTSAKSLTDTIYRLTRTNIKKITSGKKKITVNHYQNSKATGYKIQYASNKNFTNSITKTIKGYKNSTTTLTTNYGNRTYYVRIRPYKVVDGKTYYGAWSTTKSAYVKK